MIEELINLIKLYLDGVTITVPNGYKNITGEYNFYHFLEDYLFDNWDDIITAENYSIVDELPELCAETEPHIDTVKMDVELRKLYNELIKLI